MLGELILCLTEIEIGICFWYKCHYEAPLNDIFNWYSLTVQRKIHIQFQNLGKKSTLTVHHWLKSWFWLPLAVLPSFHHLVFVDNIEEPSDLIAWPWSFSGLGVFLAWFLSRTDCEPVSWQAIKSKCDENFYIEFFT